MNAMPAKHETPAPPPPDPDALFDGAGHGPGPETADDREPGWEQEAEFEPDTEPATGVASGARPAVSDTQLSAWIDRMVDRDERALAALYDATLPRVYGLVLRLVRRPALADEVVEEAYFQAWRQAPRFDPARGGALTWLLGMARSRAIDALRHEARFAYDELPEATDRRSADDSAPVDELLDAARGHAELHRALLQLSAQPRQLVALAFFRGLSHEEIACQTRLPLGTVKSQIRRALLTLRGLLGEALPLPQAS